MSTVSKLKLMQKKSDAPPRQTKTEASARVCAGGACTVESRGAAHVFRFCGLCGRPARLHVAGTQGICRGQWGLACPFGSHQPGGPEPAPGVPFAPIDR